eukprot:5070489-Prymnesium_polylepis.1
MSARARSAQQATSQHVRCRLSLGRCDTSRWLAPIARLFARLIRCSCLHQHVGRASLPQPAWLPTRSASRGSSTSCCCCACRLLRRRTPASIRTHSRQGIWWCESAITSWIAQMLREASARMS